MQTNNFAGSFVPGTEESKGRSLNELCVNSLAELEAKGITVCFIMGNRGLDSANLKSKHKSMKANQMNLVPIMYVSGDKALRDGCKLVDAKYGRELLVNESDAPLYAAIVDGQHRLSAALDLEIPHENIILMKDYSGQKTPALLATMNIDSFGWSPKDYINEADAFCKNDVITFCKGLLKRKSPISTMGYIIAFKNVKLTKEMFSNFICDDQYDLPFSYNLDRAEKFLRALDKSGIQDKIASKRYLMEVIIDLSVDYSSEVVINALSQFPKGQAETLNLTKLKEEEVIDIISKG